MLTLHPEVPTGIVPQFETVVQDEAKLLETAAVNAPNASHRWLYLDCLISTADPGDAGHAWPVDQRVIESLGPCELEHVEERVKRLREDARRS